MGLLEWAVTAAMPLLPTPFMRRLSARYIAGETLDQAAAALRALSQRGHPGIVNLLGEDAEDEAAARAALAEFRRAADRVAADGLDAYVSVKPTHFCLREDPALALRLYRELLGHCAPLGLRVRVEMEDHTTTDATLALFEELRREFDNVGLVLQSRLLRTPNDIARLAPGPLDVRMVKGIYLEPARIAHVDPEPIRAAFVECCELLHERGARIGFATHDELLATRLLDRVRARGLAHDAYELQVLMGVREPLWDAWRAAGHTVRVYVPYGPEWRAYSTRRLRRNPQILRHVLRNMLPFGERRASPTAR